MASSVDAKDNYQKLLALPNVFGVMIINTEGLAIRSNLSHEDTLKYCSQIAPLVERSRKFMKILAAFDEDQSEAAAGRATRPGGRPPVEDDLSVIRIRSLHYEMLVCPCAEGGDHIMIALQKPLHPDPEQE